MAHKAGQGRVFFNHHAVGNQPKYSGKVNIDGKIVGIALWEGEGNKDKMTYYNIRVTDIIGDAK